MGGLPRRETFERDPPEHDRSRCAAVPAKGPGKEAKLAYLGHALMENRHGLLVDFQITTPLLARLNATWCQRLIDAARGRANV